MSQPLTNTNINSFLDHIDGFVGTFPSDIVPIHKKDEPQAFVINTAPDGSSGEHWTALILTKQLFLKFKAGKSASVTKPFSIKCIIVDRRSFDTQGDLWTHKKMTLLY